MKNFYDDYRYSYLNRNSALPLYYQLKEHIKDAILRGFYKPNDKLPTEEELCKFFDISRPVVRQAYDELMKEGLVGRRKGSGTFVKEKTLQNGLFKKFVSFSFEQGIEDLEENSKIIQIEEVVDPRIAQRLKIGEDEPIFRVVRVVTEIECPLSLIESYLPLSYFKNIGNYIMMAIDRPLIDTIEKFYGIRVIKAKRSLDMVPITEERNRYLNGDDDELSYEIETHYYDSFGRIAILEYTTYLKSIVEFSVEITRK